MVPPPSFQDLLHHDDWLRGLARRLVQDSSRAEDLVQDTWVAALQHPPRDRATARGWLARVLVNFHRQRRRREGVVRSNSEEVARREVEAPSPAHRLERDEVCRLLAERLLALDEPFRSTLVDRYVHGRSPMEIAQATGTPPGTVRRRLKTGLERMRADLDRRGARRDWCAALIGVLHLDPGRMQRASWMTPVAAAAVVLTTLAGSVGWSLAGGSTRTALDPAVADLAGFDRGPPVEAVDLPRRNPVEVALVVGSSGNQVELEAHAPTVGRVHVSVVHADGSPAASARVRVVTAAGLRDRGHTDGRGTLDLPLEAGDLVPAGRPRLGGRVGLQADVPGHVASGLVYALPDGGAPVELRLGGSALTLVGRVVDPSGMPVAGAHVSVGTEEAGSSVWDGDHLRMGHRVEWITDDAGRFRLEHLRPAIHFVSVLADGYLRLRHEASAFVPGEHTVEIVLEVGASVKGTVRGPDGAPLPGALVWAEPRVRVALATHGVPGVTPRLAGFSRAVTADASGAFTLSSLAPGEAELWARSPDHGELLARAEITLQSNELSHWDPHLAQRHGLRLRLVQPDGAACAGWGVRLALDPTARFDWLARGTAKFHNDDAGPTWMRLEVTDEEGRLELFDIPDEAVTLTVYRPGGSLSVPLGSVEPRVGEQLLTVPAAAAPAGIVGRLVRTDGGELGTALLLVRDLATQALVEVTVGRDGAFDLRLPPSHHQLAVDLGPRGGAAILGDLVLEAGELRDMGQMELPAFGSLTVVGGGPGVEYEISSMLLMADGSQLTRELESGNGEVASNYDLLGGFYGIRTSLSDGTLSFQFAQLMPGRESRFDATPGAATFVPFRWEEPSGTPRGEQLFLLVRPLDEDAPVLLERTLKRGSGGTFDALLPVPEGKWVVEGETELGARTTYSLEMLHNMAVGPRTVALR